MRPRRIAAENRMNSTVVDSGSDRFNEAAANRRGKPSMTTWLPGKASRFNEAAANRRGKRPAMEAAYLLAWRASLRALILETSF